MVGGGGGGCAAFAHERPTTSWGSGLPRGGAWLIGLRGIFVTRGGPFPAVQYDHPCLCPRRWKQQDLSEFPARQTQDVSFRAPPTKGFEPPRSPHPLEAAQVSQKIPPIQSPGTTVAARACPTLRPADPISNRQRNPAPKMETGRRTSGHQGPDVQGGGRAQRNNGGGREGGVR